MEPPRRLPPPKLVITGSGVTRQATGPGRGALALLALAGVLAMIAIYLYATRPAKKVVTKEVDAGQVIAPVGAPDASAIERDPAMPDAAVAMADAARVPPDTVTPDAKPPKPDAAADDPIARAKALYDQAFGALEESNYEKTLQLVDQSIKLRRTARSYVLRAQALQRLGRVDEALEALDSAETLFSSPSIYEARARIFKAAGRRDEARAAIEKYLSMVPDRGNTVKLFKQWLEELR